VVSVREPGRQTCSDHGTVAGAPSGYDTPVVVGVDAAHQLLLALKVLPARFTTGRRHARPGANAGYALIRIAPSPLRNVTLVTLLPRVPSAFNS